VSAIELRDVILAAANHEPQKRPGRAEQIEEGVHGDTASASSDTWERG